jgi:class 3 adenylate cyclase
VGHGESVNEIAVLGSAANLAARLSSAAGQGEIMISQEAMECAGESGEVMEQDELALKGIAKSVPVHVMRVG